MLSCKDFTLESREKDAVDTSWRKPLPSGLKKKQDKNTGGRNFDPHDNSQNTVEVAIKQKQEIIIFYWKNAENWNIYWKLMIFLSLNISFLYVKTVFFFF